MATNDSDFHNGHRERLRQKFLDDKLSDAEKLELMLGYVIPRKDVRVLSHRLIEQFGNLSGILTAPIDVLNQCDGVGRNTAIFIKLINQLMLDGYKSHMSDKPFFHTPEILNNYCLNLLSGKKTEELHVLYLDTDSRLLESSIHTRGTADESAVYPGEILRHAIQISARRVVLVHNHPRTDGSFSTADVQITQTIANLLAAVGIDLYDHLLVAGGRIYSAKNMHLFNN